MNFQPPNIYTSPGAEWTRRVRVPGGEWEDEGLQSPEQFPKAPVKRVLRSKYRAPANIGTKFYVSLKKLGYKRDPLTGDYR